MITAIKFKLKEILPSKLLALIYILKYSVFAKLPFIDKYLPYFDGKSGLEIGGPSLAFRYPLPIYKKMTALDGVNFSNQTHWEGRIEEGMTYQFHENKIGYQYISDGTELSQIADGKYDFVISSNCLEHIANPLKALFEWSRVLKDDGLLLLVLPNKISNFDKNRPTTSFEHILEDYNNQTTEHDLTCLDEVLSLTVFEKELSDKEKEDFKNRCLDNFNNRYLHHHVFDLEVMQKMMTFIGFETLQKDEHYYNFYLLARKNRQ